MRKVSTSLCAFALVAAGGLLLASTAMAAGKGPPKVLICHHGIDDITGLPTSDIIAAPTRVVGTHIANHGDNVVSLEVCDGVDNDCNGAVDDYPTDCPAATVCNSQTGDCEPCGDWFQRCCSPDSPPGFRCAHLGSGCSSYSNTCVPCGNLYRPCCEPLLHPFPCFAGALCDPDTNQCQMPGTGAQ